METLRLTAAVLLLTTGLLDIPYGWFFVAGYASYIWYAMGAVYVITAGILALNFRRRFLQLWALAYTLFLLSAWVTGGYRDIVAFADKAVEVILVINMVFLIRASWPAPIIHSQ